MGACKVVLIHCDCDYSVVDLIDVYFFLIKWLTSAEDFRSLIALVGLNGQGVGTSVFSEWVKKIAKLNLPESEKQNLDVLVEQIYDDMDSGKFKSD